MISTAPGLRADGRIRTGDLILTKDALYRLSYISALSCDNGGIIPHMTSKSKCFLKIIFFVPSYSLQELDQTGSCPGVSGSKITPSPLLYISS